MPAVDRRLFLAGMAAFLLSGCRTAAHGLSVGSKNFTEQLLLGEMLAQVLQQHTGAAVERRFYLAGSYICHQAILAKRIDAYVEYTGTALAAILKLPIISDSAKVFETVRREYQRRFNLVVLPSLGFNNTFAIALRGEDARRLRISKLSDLAAVAHRMRMGVGYEFLERADGFTGLAKTYGLQFAEPPRVMDLGLLYRALESRQVDVIAGSNTDGLIAALGLMILDDDRHYFPPYDAVPIVRPEVLRNPQVQAAFESLQGRIATTDMRQMNLAVDGEKRDAAEVVREYLRRINA